MQTTFAEVLDTIEEFSLDEKETLVDILQHRLREAKRQRVTSAVEDSYSVKNFLAGRKAFSKKQPKV